MSVHVALKHLPLAARSRVEKFIIASSKAEEYSIKAGYKHRQDNSFFDDTMNKDEWQREVYEAAADYLGSINGSTVYDVGCGSGHKLLKHFSHADTVGYDLPATVEFLRKQHPDRDWQCSDLGAIIKQPADIVICSDVIEHIPDPDVMMGFLSNMTFDRLFLSTPDRELVYGHDHSGPPLNISHCREWTRAEFANYVAQWFVIEDHLITNEAQATQMIVARNP